MRTITEVLIEDFPDTILNVSSTAPNVYAVIVAPDTDLSEFAGVLEDVLPDYFPTDEFISIYVSKENEDREILVQMNIPED